MKRKLIAIAIRSCSPALAQDADKFSQEIFFAILPHTTPDQCAKNLSEEMPNCWAEWIKFRDYRRQKADSDDAYKKALLNKIDKGLVPNATPEMRDKVNSGLAYLNDCGFLQDINDHHPCISPEHADGIARAQQN